MVPRREERNVSPHTFVGEGLLVRRDSLHVSAIAKGEAHSGRLLCRSHNDLHVRQTYGSEVIGEKIQRAGSAPTRDEVPDTTPDAEE